MKKFLSLVVAALLSVSAITTASAAKFTDVDANNEALTDAVELLTALNVTKGTTETTFGTTENVTRQQMAAFIYRMMKAGKSVEGGVNTSSFTDLDDPTFYFMVSWADSQGIIKGRNATTFDPKGGIILQDAYTMVVRALGYDDGTLSYPIGFISKAEDLGLDADLPSSVNYTSTLTRGDVAIILANMFYAETAETEIKYVSSFDWVCKAHDDTRNCDGQPNAAGVQCNPQAVSNGQIPQEYHKTIAEEVFNVMKISQRVIATPNYTFGTAKKIEEDVEMVTLSWSDIVDFDNEKAEFKKAYKNNNGDLATVEFEKLGLEGKADDYFLSDILMFVRINDKGEPEIFGATAQGTKNTVTFDQVEFGTVFGSAKENYYDPDDKQYKHIDGKLVLDGTVTYLYDAPFSFTGLAGSTKYNAKFITLGKYYGDMTSEDEADHIKFNYVLDNSGINDIIGARGTEAQRLGLVVDVNDNGTPDDKTDDIKTYGALAPIYFGGLGEIDVYDCDGNGKPDYLFVKRYTTGTVDTEEEMELKDGLVAGENAKNNVIFTDMAIVDGEANDKDIVLAYVNQPANYVKVIETLTAKDASLTSSTDDYFVLSTGEKILFENKDFIVVNAAKNLEALDANKINDNYFTKESKYYFTADGRLVYAPVTSVTATNLDEVYTIVIDDKSFNSTQIVDGKMISDQYIEVYSEGQRRAVKAKKIVKDKGVYEANVTPETTVVNELYDYSAYLDRLAVAKADKDGAWYFKLINVDGFNNYAALANDDANAEFRVIGQDDIKFNQYRNNVYNLGSRRVNIRDYTQIIIQYNDKNTNEPVWETYGIDNLPDIADTVEFDKVSYILVNNVNSTTTENLAVFYGVVDGDFKGSKGKMDDIRVVNSYTRVSGEDGMTHVYELLNPFTGKVETDVECYEIADKKFESGDIVALTTTGLIDDTVDGVNNGKAVGNVYDLKANGIYNADSTAAFNTMDLGYVYLAEYDEETGAMYLANKEEYKEVTEDGIKKMKYVTSEEITAAAYQVTDETVVTFSDDSDNSFKLLDTSVLASAGKAYKQGDETKCHYRVFLAVEESEDFDVTDPFYDVIFAMIVRD